MRETCPGYSGCLIRAASLPLTPFLFVSLEACLPKLSREAGGAELERTPARAQGLWTKATSFADES